MLFGVLTGCEQEALSMNEGQGVHENRNQIP